MSDPWRIETQAQIEELLGQPSPVVQSKVFDHVDEYAAAFIAKAPFLMLATTDPGSGVDVSPKGDAPGFVVVDDEKTLLLPDRPGNKLAFGFRNILRDPHVSLIFVVPGVTETLRVNGTAELTREPALLERLSAKGKPALLVTRIRVDQCFFHCGKALIRSSLWKAESWPTGYRVNLGKQLAKKMGADDQVAGVIEEALVDSYKNDLY